MTALYRAADVMLVTPIRDGMNLVAKEFVAARTDDDGVLVLSEFAGAAAELAEALLVNPYDVEGTAEALLAGAADAGRGAPHPDDRAARAGRRPTTCTAGPASSSTAWARTSSRRTRSARRRQSALAAAEARIRDGALGDAAPRLRRDAGAVRAHAGPRGARRRAARRCSRRSPGRYVVHVVSGRRRDTLERWLGALPIGLHAEHGFWSPHAGRARGTAR